MRHAMDHALTPCTLLWVVGAALGGGRQGLQLKREQLKHLPLKQKAATPTLVLEPACTGLGPLGDACPVAIPCTAAVEGQGADEGDCRLHTIAGMPE